MTNTQILIAIIAVAIVSFTGLGLMRAATADSENNHRRMGHSFGKGGLHRTHWFDNHDWQDTEKLQTYKAQCKEKGAHKFDHFMQHVDERLQLNAEQQLKWQALVVAIESEADTVNQVCEKIFTRENLADTPARMELMTTVMAMSTESLQRLQPAVNSVYQSLDAEQKNEFDSMLTHRRHRAWF